MAAGTAARWEDFQEDGDQYNESYGLVAPLSPVEVY